ncbi:unnamed protein product [Microthlaspi erraticum]|uniref:Uncharacterized protein n=1 Tax=Microthlaspi erraticum TaxID=1685480 RepID=A0A6D2KEK2_9BRAS|nr:unnamed protein product [Microthlaspi erraticum]
MEISYLDKQEGYENSAPKELGGKVVVRRGARRPSGALHRPLRATRSSLLSSSPLFILEMGVASLALVELGSLEAVVRGDVESGFTKLLDLCKCTDRGSMGIEHKDWLLSTL